jgi:glycosyltransferase involved in cell wall biosynthesis
MRLAVLSHACITPINQDFYARVQERSDWELTILLPNRWRSEYGAQRPAQWPRFRGDLVPLSARLAGNIPLHCYSGDLRRELRRRRPDVLYVHHEPYALATYQAVRAASALGGLPLGFYSAQNLTKRYHWPISEWERKVYSCSRFALPVTQAVADVLREKGYRGILEVLPLGLDVAQYRRRNGRSGCRFTLGYVGRLSEEKGVDTLLDALAYTTHEDMGAVIVGDGPAREALHDRARRLSVDHRIRWAGYVPHDAIQDSYLGMDVLVVPSRTVPNWTEQFGRVVLEALASGVPVLTSDSGELPHLVELTGGGWTFPEGDSKSLARTLDELRKHPAAMRESAKRGRRAVERLFDLDALAQRFVKVVAEATGKD